MLQGMIQSSLEIVARAGRPNHAYHGRANACDSGCIPLGFPRPPGEYSGPLRRSCRGLT
jgi:hypothetical protein